MRYQNQLFVEYSKEIHTSCNQRYGSYPNLIPAQLACTSDINCLSVRDNGCDGSGPYQLCSRSGNIYPYSNVCIHMKGTWSFKWIRWKTYLFSLVSICYQSFIHFLIATGCANTGDCSGAADTCTEGQCKCGAYDMCRSVRDHINHRWIPRKCSLGQCIDA